MISWVRAHPVRLGFILGALVGAAIAVFGRSGPERELDSEARRSLGTGEAQGGPQLVGVPVPSSGVDVGAAPIRWPITVRVLSDAGTPIADALLYYSPIAAVRVPASSTSVVRTGADGIGSVGAPLSEDHVLIAAATGYVARSTSVSQLAEAAQAAQGGGQSFPIRLSTGVRVRGIVVNSRGSPIPHARVVCVGRGGADVLADLPGFLPGVRHAAALQLALADDQGNFEVRGVRELPVQMWAEHTAHISRHDLGGLAHVATETDGVVIRLNELLYRDLRAVDRATGAIVDHCAWDVACNPQHSDAIAGRPESPIGSAPAPSLPPAPGTGVFRQHFVALGDLDMEHRAPMVRVEALGYRRAQTRIFPLLMLGGAQPAAGEIPPPLIVMLDAIDPARAWGGIELALRIPHSSEAPRAVRVRLVGRDLDESTGDARPTSVAVIALDPITSEPGAGRALVRVPVGRYELQASLDLGGGAIRFAPTEIDVQPGSAARVNLETVATPITITAVDPLGHPLGDFRVGVYRPARVGSAAAGVERVAAAVFLISRLEWLTLPDYAEDRRMSGDVPAGIGRIWLAPGEYLLDTRAEGFESAQREILIAPSSSPTSIVVELVPRG